MERLCRKQNEIDWKEMDYNERLMIESLKGDDDALKELKFNAGAGDCEAQYYLAMYFAKAYGHLHDVNYHYWLAKSKENGYVPGVEIVRELTPEQLNSLEQMKLRTLIKYLIFEYRILIGLGVF